MPGAERPGELRKRKAPITVREIVLFALLGGLMFAQKYFLEQLVSVQFMALLIVSSTLVYRAKALYPIYIYVFLYGMRAGFSAWWLPEVYIWLPLWGMAMALPKNLPRKFAAPMYMLACGVHGLAFGTMFAPVWALYAHLSWKATLNWIAAGLVTADLIHCINNIVWGVLVLPLAGLLRRLEKVKH